MGNRETWPLSGLNIGALKLEQENDKALSELKKAAFHSASADYELSAGKLQAMTALRRYQLKRTAARAIDELEILIRNLEHAKS